MCCIKWNWQQYLNVSCENSKKKQKYNYKNYIETKSFLFIQLKEMPHFQIYFWIWEGLIKWKLDQQLISFTTLVICFGIQQSRRKCQGKLLNC